MKFENFKIGMKVIWLVDNDLAEIIQINKKYKSIIVRWYKHPTHNEVNPFDTELNGASLEEIILDKRYYFDRDMENLLND